MLERNYRSTRSILQAANHLIAHNRQRKPKDLVTEQGSGQPVTVLTYENGVEEAEGVAGRILKAVQGGERHYRDFAIFLRMNALSRALEAAFIKNRMPYQIVKGLAFFERKENRDVLAYLRLLLNTRDDLSFLRAVNEPARARLLFDWGVTSVFSDTPDIIRPARWPNLDASHDPALARQGAMR